MRVALFRYVSTGKRAVLPYGGGDKTKQMGLGDISVEPVEAELLQFFKKHGAAISSNAAVCQPATGGSSGSSAKLEGCRPLPAVMSSKKEFLEEFKEWLNGASPARPHISDDSHAKSLTGDFANALREMNHTSRDTGKLYGIYILYVTGSGTEDGDLQLPAAAAPTTGFAAHGGSRREKQAAAGGMVVTLLDIEKTWEEFKSAHFPKAITYDNYRKVYHGNRLSASMTSMSRARSSQLARAGTAAGGATVGTRESLNSKDFSQVQPLLWIISDVDYSNAWVDQAYAKNYRDIVIQASADESACPVNIFVKGWVQLQDGIIDNRQFSLILKTFGGTSCIPKCYTMPGFKFPAWSRPKFSELLEILHGSRFSQPVAETSGSTKRKSWLFQKVTDKKEEKDTATNKRHPGFKPLTQHGGNEPWLCPVQLVQGRKNNLSANFSTLQYEVEETLQELEALRCLYSDNDMRPGKDNYNNIFSMQDKENSFSLEKLIYVVSSIKIYLYNPNVCFKALKSLWALTYDEEVRSELVNVSIIQVILKVTDIHIGDSTICLYATGVISRCAWNMKIWRDDSGMLNQVWNLLLEFLLIHPMEEELVRLIGVTLSALAVEKGSQKGAAVFEKGAAGAAAFPIIFPILVDLCEMYIDSAPTVYALSGAILQLIQHRVPEESEDCLRVFAIFMQITERHPKDASLHRQCALGMIKLSTSGRAKDIFVATPAIVNLWITLVDEAIQNFMKEDPYIVWQFVSALLNILKSHGNAMKALLFVHPTARNIYKNSTLFVANTTEGGYTEVLKQRVREFIEIFQSEKHLMRQLIIAERKTKKF